MMLTLLGCVAVESAAREESDHGEDSPPDSVSTMDSRDSGHANPDPPGADGVLTVCDDGTAEFLDFPEAAEEAGEGDTVTICPGTYNASPPYGWSNLFSVVGAGMGVTTLVAQDVASAMLYFSGFNGASVDTEIRVEGMTLDANGTDCTQILVVDGQDSAFVIRDLELVGHRSTSYDTPVLSVDTSNTLLIEDVWIHDNEVTASGSGDEPLIWAWYPSTATLRHAVIADNTVTDNHLVMLSAGVAIIEDSVFTRNNVVDDVMVGAYSIAYPVAADDGESGVWNCVFSGNTADGMMALGPRVEGSVFVENVSDYAMLTAYNTDEQYNLFFGNNYEVFHGSSYHWVDDTDLELDPLFTNPAADDYTLLPGSPAIDAGNPDAAYNDPDGSRNDMGAYGGPNASW